MDSLIGAVETRSVAEEIVDAFDAVTSERISEGSVSDRGFAAVVREKEIVFEEPADPSLVRDCLLTLAVGLTPIWGATEAIPLARRKRAARNRNGAQISENPYGRSSGNDPPRQSGE